MPSTYVIGITNMMPELGVLRSTNDFMVSLASTTCSSLTTKRTTLLNGLSSSLRTLRSIPKIGMSSMLTSSSPIPRPSRIVPPLTPWFASSLRMGSRLRSSLRIKVNNCMSGSFLSSSVHLASKARSVLWLRQSRKTADQREIFCKCADRAKCQLLCVRQSSNTTGKACHCARTRIRLCKQAQHERLRLSLRNTSNAPLQASLHGPFDMFLSERCSFAELSFAKKHVLNSYFMSCFTRKSRSWSGSGLLLNISPCFFCVSLIALFCTCYYPLHLPGSQATWRKRLPRSRRGPCWQRSRRGVLLSWSTLRGNS